jgi:glucosamine--fructose-6-phosphate aminotransferase (isomerizing)
MEMTGTHTRHEIASQPEAWATALADLAGQADALGELFARGGYDSLLFTGCGSTYYLAIAAAAVAQELCGLPARGLPASELWLDMPAAARVGRKPLLIAVSRSGATTETIRACEAWLAVGGDLLTLSCYPEQPLATMGRLNLLLASGQEQSIAQTRAFSTLYLAALFAAARWAGRDDLLAALQGLPAAGRRALAAGQAPARAVGADLGIDRIYVLGSGLRYGLACELSLKLKEMSLSHSEPFHFLEFRHGPKSMVTPETLVIGLRSEANRAHEQAVLDEMQAQGGRTLTLAEGDAEVSFGSGLPESVRAILYLPPLQQLAFERSLARGLDPDRPLHLDAVVRLG